jgi:hypothetical protein
MHKSRMRAALAVVCCLHGFPAAAAFGQGLTGDSVVEQARAHYYNLSQQGLKEFRCDVRLDWNAVRDAHSGDAGPGPELLPLLRETHFEAVLGATGAPRVSLHFDGAAPSDELAARVRAASAGAEQALSGVLQEVSSVLFGSLLPPDRDYHLEPQGDRFRITFGSDELRIVESMNKDGALQEMIVATQRSTVTVRPQFTRLDQGFLPVVIDSSVEAAGAEKVELHVAIAYQAVQGVELPQTVSVRDKQLAGGSPVEFRFSNYQLTR